MPSVVIPVDEKYIFGKLDEPKTVDETAKRVDEGTSELTNVSSVVALENSGNEVVGFGVLSVSRLVCEDKSMLVLFEEVLNDEEKTVLFFENTVGQVV